MFKSSLYQVKIYFIKTFFRLAGSQAMISFLVWDTLRKTKKLRADQPVILACDKTHFSKDIDQMSRTGDFNYLRLNNGYIELFQSLLVPSEVMRQTYYQQTQSTTFKQQWNILEDFGVRLIKALQKKINRKINLILVSHVDYGHVEFLRLAGKSFQIPFASLVRENFILEREKRDVRDYYKNLNFKFLGQKILVFSEATKAILESAEVADSQLIEVTGAPRFDHWIEKQKLNSQKKIITLFSFSHPDYLAPEAFKTLLFKFVDAAKEFPDLIFYVKAKDRIDYFRILSYLDNKIPRNMQVGFRFDNKQLLEASNLILGFNSLALLEGLMAGCNVAIPYFMDAARPDSFLMYTPNIAAENSCLHFLRSPQDLTQLISSCVEKNFIQDTNDLSHCINKIVLFSKNQSSTERVENTLRGIIHG